MNIYKTTFPSSDNAAAKPRVDLTNPKSEKQVLNLLYAIAFIIESIVGYRLSWYVGAGIP